MKARVVEDPDYKTEAEKTAEEVQDTIGALGDEAEEGTDLTAPIYMRPVILEVERQYPNSEPVADEPTTVMVQDFHAPPAEVGVDMGLTLQLRPYESARISVSLRVPCYREEAAEAFEFAQRFVHERLDAERDAIRAWARKDAGGKSDNHMF